MKKKHRNSESGKVHGTALGLLWMLLLLGVVSCGRSSQPSLQVENHSFARPDEIVVEHLDLDLDVDFDRERISGSVALRIVNKVGAEKLYLDTYGLRIEAVTLGEDQVETTFHLGEAVPHLGQPLVVDVLPETKRVNVYYETTGEATALEWLKPPPLQDNKKPFFYTQGQAILNRSWIPCQDTPGIRVTYAARIKTPPGMMALMSAENGTEKNPDGVYWFHMRKPIPVYLVALAVGDIEFRPISERCGVYAEPDMVEQAAWEFADTDSMMRTAEALYGPYRWERYDILVLPPSFPFGGMENPRLSFVTPVLVAGDRSLVSTIAHELAHSWSGNLVTNATWNDFWLNEGFTTYIERRITEALYGVEHMEMLAVIGRDELNEELSLLGADSPDTRLHIDTGERNPDDGLVTVAYEKGYLFLRVIEEAVGRERFDAFLHGYFDRFAFQSMTSERFVAHLRQELVQGDTELEAALQIEEWVDGTGLPSNCPEIRSTALEEATQAAELWSGGRPTWRLKTSDWTSQEWKAFIQNLPDSMTIAQMSELDAAFDFSNQTNGEILQVWFEHVIVNRYEAAYPQMESFLNRVGRIWLITSLYRKLAETPEGLEMARRIYNTARPGYHPLAAGAVDRILEDGGSEE